MNLKYKLLDSFAKAPVISGHDGDKRLTAGINLFSRVKVRINTHSYEMIPTGVGFEIPANYMGMLKARSGFAAKTGTIVNAGVIDSNYRGEIIVIINNPTDKIVDVAPGMGIAQMLLLPVPHISLEVTENLSITERGSQGFGSTGD